MWTTEDVIVLASALATSNALWALFDPSVRHTMDCVFASRSSKATASGDLLELFVRWFWFFSRSMASASPPPSDVELALAVVGLERHLEAQSLALLLRIGQRRGGVALKAICRLELGKRLGKLDSSDLDAASL